MEFSVPFQHKYGYIRDEWFDLTAGLTPTGNITTLAVNFPPKLQPGSSFGALIFDLRIRSRHQTFHKSNAGCTRTRRASNGYHNSSLTDDGTDIAVRRNVVRRAVECKGGRHSNATAVCGYHRPRWRFVAAAAAFARKTDDEFIPARRTALAPS